MNFLAQAIRCGDCRGGSRWRVGNDGTAGIRLFRRSRNGSLVLAAGPRPGLQDDALAAIGRRRVTETFVATRLAYPR